MLPLFRTEQIKKETIKTVSIIFLLGILNWGCDFENSSKKKNEPTAKIDFQSSMSDKGNYLSILEAGGKHKCGDFLVEFKFEETAREEMSAVLQSVFILPMKNHVIHFKSTLKNKIQNISCRDLNNDGLSDLYIRLWDGGNDFGSYQSHLYRMSANHLARISSFVDPWFAEQRFSTLESKGKIFFATKN